MSFMPRKIRGCPSSATTTGGCWGVAKRKRKEPTAAGKRLWRLLRDRRLAGFKFRRQVPVAGFVLDFYCMKAGVVVEADGGQHLEPEAKAYDLRRTNELARLGIRVLRFPDDEILKYSGR